MEGPQGLQVPLHLGRDVQRLGAPRDLHDVGAHAAGDQDVGHREGNLPQASYQVGLRRLGITTAPPEPGSLTITWPTKL